MTTRRGIYLYRFLATTIWTLFCASCLPLAAAQGTGPVKQFPTSGVLRFELRDRLDHPLYWWPRTLLNYPVRFEPARVKAGDLRLVNAGNREPAPFQLSSVKERNGFLDFAVVSFFADLPAGESRTFELSAGGGAAVAKPQVSERRDGDSIILDTGAVRVRIPASHSVRGDAPGPIHQASWGREWMGSSRIVSPKRLVEAIATAREEAGPLFITYKIVYRFQNGGRYAATVRAVSGYDFVYVFDEMQGLEPGEGIHVRMDWTGFHPTHRLAPNHSNGRGKSDRGFQRYDWETIDQATVGTSHGVSGGLASDGELPFRLGPYQPWNAYVMLTSANFWDERSNNAVGVFIDRVNRWQDHEYAIWASSNTLQVKYFYSGGLLSWKWPLSTGTRSTAVAVYDHRKDIDAMERLDKLSEPFKYRDGLTHRAHLSPMSHTMFLQNRFGTIDLDMVKDWVLEYPAEAKRPDAIFREGIVESVGELERRIFTGAVTNELPAPGTRQSAGFSPVSSRIIGGMFIDAYNRFYSQMNERQRQRLTAMYLMMAYTHGEEDYMPLKTMLAGHPNFLSDVKSVPPLFAFLFPDHPMAREWADEFQKYLELNTRYHTRPAVTAWDAKGGRWTENLGTYVWAFLHPASRAEYSLRLSVDGKNRFAIPEIAQIGDWLVNALSAPFNGEDPKPYLDPDGKLPRHYWGMVTAQNGPRRLHPPQGAHSSRRKPPKTMWLLGKSLLNYEPIVAEHMMWAARPDDGDAEHMNDQPDPWSILFTGADNRGTNPHLKSSKYTGYGVTLRAAVDSPEELSVHLQQIDEGPNYRWGIAGEGGCGVIYYYAQGKSYSHNGKEDVGDRVAHDTDFCTNFGVWKNGMFRSIGRNVLDRPMYDLGIAQFTEIVPRKGPQSYAWPEYQSRSVMLAGSDYLVIYDDVYNDAVPHRFSWFTQVNDEMPFIHLVKGGVRERVRLATQVSTGTTKGVWYDGMGDAMAVVSHRRDLNVENTAYGARVKTGQAEDLVFRNPEGVRFSQGDSAFEGTAGIIRSRPGGRSEIGMFHGSTISHRGLTLAVDNPDLAISASFQALDEITGVFSSSQGGGLQVRIGLQSEKVALYIDGVRQPPGMRLRLPAGTHRWEVTASLPMPNPPAVIRTENRAGGAVVHFEPAAGAANYRVEVSRDGGRTWSVAGSAPRSPYVISGLPNGVKVHVRVTGLNEKRTGRPGPEYPVYVSDHAPAPPDGLKLSLQKDRVTAVWGEVLGASEYRLYRRLKGSAQFERIYAGLRRSFTDAAPGVIPAMDEPGAAANALRAIPPHKIYEYAIAAVNGNGESKRATPVDTDPTSWVNWDPRPGERFRRRYTYNTSNYLSLGKEEEIQRYYPR